MLLREGIFKRMKYSDLRETIEEWQLKEAVAEVKNGVFCKSADCKK